MPDAIPVHCPACGVRLRMPVAALGRSVRCPQCSHKFQADTPDDSDPAETVPQPESSGPPPEQHPVAEAPHAPEPADDKLRKTKKARRKKKASGLPVAALAGGGVLLVVVVIGAFAFRAFSGRAANDAPAPAAGMRAAGEATPEGGRGSALSLRFAGPLPFGEGRCNALAYSADGALLAIARPGNAVEVWDIGTGARKANLGPHKRAPNRVAFHPNGRWLYSTDFDGGVYQWDIPTGTQLRWDRPPFAEVFDLAASPDGELLAVVGRTALDRSALHRYRCGTFEKLPVLRLSKGSKAEDVVRAAFAPDAKTLAVGGVLGTVALLSPPDGAEPVSLDWPISAAAKNAEGASPFASEGVTGLRFAADGRRLAASRKIGAIRVWNLLDRSMATDWDFSAELRKRLQGTLTALALSPSGLFLAAGDGEGYVTLWSLADHKQVARENLVTAKKMHGVEPIVELHFQPDGRRLVSLGGLLQTGADAHSWEADFGGAGPKPALTVQAPERTAVAMPPRTLRPRIRFPAGGTKPCVFRADGQRVATLAYDAGTKEMAIAYWDPATGGRAGGLDLGKRAWDLPIRLSPDFRRLMLATGLGLELWDAERKVLLRKLPDPAPATVDRVCFSADSKTLAHRTEAGIDLWSLERNERAGQIPTEPEAPWGAWAFFPDGKKLALARRTSTGGNSTVSVLELADRKTLAAVDLGECKVYDLQFLGGDRLAIATNKLVAPQETQAELRFWDPQQPKTDRPLRLPSMFWTANSDGRRLCDVRVGTIYDLAAGRVSGVAALGPLQSEGSVAVAFRPAGHLLAASARGVGLFRGDDGILETWVAFPTGTPLQQAPVLSPDGHFLATIQGVWEVSPDEAKDPKDLEFPAAPPKR